MFFNRVNMKCQLYIFIVHILLLVLASTNYSIVMFIREGTSLSWSYATYSYHNGWGYEFVSEYTLLQILTYIIAYVTGMILFGSVYLRGMKGLGTLGFSLCIVGFISFFIEGSHWILDHHLSWIASFPIVLTVLWIVLSISLFNNYWEKTKVP